MGMAGIQFITDALTPEIIILQQLHRFALRFTCQHKFEPEVLAESGEAYRYTAK